MPARIPQLLAAGIPSLIVGLAAGLALGDRSTQRAMRQWNTIAIGEAVQRLDHAARIRLGEHDDARADIEAAINRQLAAVASNHPSADGLNPAELHALAIIALYADRFPGAYTSPDAATLLTSAAARTPNKPDITDPACGTSLSRLLTTN